MSVYDPNTHNPQCPCDICSGAITPADMKFKQLENLKSSGWYAHMVLEDDVSPTGFNYHTHGFSETVNHKDFQIVLPMSAEMCQTISEVLYYLIEEKGKKFEHGARFDGLIESNHDEPLVVMFIEVTEDDRQVLRIVFPDTEGNLLPKDMSIDEPNFALQWS